MSKSKKKKSLSIPPEKPSLQLSGSSRKVNVKIEGAKNGKITIAGGQIINNAGVYIDTENNVEISIVAGDVLNNYEKQIINSLDELSELIKINLPQQSSVKDLQEIITDLKTQTIMQAEEQNAPKIQHLLENISSYMNLATFASSQAEKAHKLFELIKRLLIH